MAAARPVRILLVDDDETTCTYLARTLQRDGYRVDALRDPSEVEARIRKGGYHAVILDLHLPRASGIDVLRKVRSIDDDVAAIVITGFPDLETAVASMKLQAVDYLGKPIELDRLRSVLARVIADKGLTTSREEDLHRTIGEAIRAVRKDRGLTLKQLARRTGLSVSLLSEIERAQASPSISSLFRIATALDVPITRMFDGL